MTIETKYNIGDEVWFQDHEEHPIKNDILGIEIETYKHKQLIKYLFEQDGFLFTIYEEDLFPTKEELLKSL